jgi:hypothetical protein
MMVAPHAGLRFGGASELATPKNKSGIEQAAAVSAVLPQLVLVGLTLGWIDRSWTFGFLPGFIAVGVAAAAIFIVSWITPEGTSVEGYFAPQTTSLSSGSKEPVHA